MGVQSCMGPALFLVWEVPRGTFGQVGKYFLVTNGIKSGTLSVGRYTDSRRGEEMGIDFSRIDEMVGQFWPIDTPEQREAVMYHLFWSHPENVYKSLTEGEWAS